MNTVKTVLFRIEGKSEDGGFSRQVRRVTDSLWRHAGAEEGMATWFQKRDKRYKVDPVVNFIQYENIDPDTIRSQRPPESVFTPQM